jgi:lysophospholipase L1-like esterase
MKNILCFGDSNTYGYKPDGTGRYDFSVRYPGRLQMILGDEYRIIEEGCPGRTTVFEDENHPYRKGIDYITPCLNSHNPIDYVVVMLGTNDCKTCFRANGREIAAGLERIIESIKKVSGASTGILIVSPIHLGENIGKPGYDPEFDLESSEVIKTLAAEYRELAEKTDCDYLDASKYARPSPIDEEHLDTIGHYKLANAIAEILGRDNFLENRCREMR